MDSDWYDILGCNIDSTNEQISKAARKLALKYHPDKNPTPKAQEKFLQIQKAKDFLLDESKRKEYDDAFRQVMKRKEYDKNRSKCMDEKRKRMRTDLEERMKSVNPNQKRESGKAADADSSHGKNKDILEQLRKQNLDRMNESSAQAAEKAHRAGMYENQFKWNLDSKSTSGHQIKVKWRKSKISHSDDSLYKLFQSFGTIENISFVGDKGATAIITFTKLESVNIAIDAFCDSQDFKVTDANSTSTKSASSIFTHNYHETPVQNSPIPDNLKSHIKTAVEKEELLRFILKRNSSGKSSDNYMNPIVDNEDNRNGPIPNENNRTTSDPSEQNYSDTKKPAEYSPINPITDVNGLAQKESDVLAKMLAAAALRKQQQQRNEETEVITDSSKQAAPVEVV